jgi:hypothetical protein
MKLNVDYCEFPTGRGGVYRIGSLGHLVSGKVLKTELRWLLGEEIPSA